jgi:hypothetical protein
VYAAINEFGFPGKCVRIVQLTIKHSKCSMRVQLRLSTHFETTHSFRHGDEAACLNLMWRLIKVTRGSGIQTRGAIVCKLVQLLA